MLAWLILPSWAQAQPTTLVAKAPPTANLPSSPSSGAEVPQPQAEAAALKHEAVAVALQSVEAYPDDALTFALLGSAHYNIGQSDEATDDLQKCLRLNPGQADAYGVLALIAYEKGKPEETVRLCQEALKRGASDADLLNRLGRAQMDLGNAEEAIRTLQQATALPRPAPESSYLLGQAYMQSGALAQAKDSFLKALRLQPGHTQAAFGLYTVCLRLGQAEEAARARARFQQLEAVDRRTLTDRSARQDTLTGLPQVRRVVAQTFFGAAQIHRAHGQPATAAGLFLKAAWLDADNPMYRAALESLYVQAKQFAAGVKTFEQLVAEQPTNSLNHYFLGRLHARLEQTAPAERCYRKVVELTPDWAEGYRALAELYLRIDGQAAAARTMAQKAVELEPSAPHQFLLAMARWKNQDRAGALEAAQRAVSLNPGESRYQKLLQQLQQAP